MDNRNDKKAATIIDALAIRILELIVVFSYCYD
jgi:hypothetical protein